MTVLVRLYPYNKRMGWVMRSFTHTDGKQSLKFVATRGWYEVSEQVADELAKVPQQERFPRGHRAFMIARTADEARELDAQVDESLHKEVAETVGTADTPVRATRPGLKESAPRTRSRRRTRSE